MEAVVVPAAPTRQAADAIIFAVKNAVVIPVYVLAILQCIDAVAAATRAAPGTPQP